MALLHVVQQVGHALRDALALGLQRHLLGFGVEGQEVAGCAGVDPLLHRKAHTGTRLGVTLHRIGQRHQGAGVEQVGGCRERGHRIAGPGFGGKAAVGLRLGVETVVPQARHIFHVGVLDFKQLGRIEVDLLASGLVEHVAHACHPHASPHLRHCHAERIARATLGYESLESRERVCGVLWRRLCGSTRKGLRSLRPLGNEVLLKLLCSFQPGLLGRFPRCHACLQWFLPAAYYRFLWGEIPGFP
ncbi:hypothetical protein D9M68_693580 [compost metagenome]